MTPDSEPPGLDLDRLIGELLAEGARHRAEPAFPQDDEIALGIELDRRAPGRGRPSLEGPARLVEEISSKVGPVRSSGDRGGPARDWLRSGSLGRLAGAVEQLGGALRELASTTGAALRATGRRVEKLERRFDAWESTWPSAPLQARDGPTQEPTAWIPALFDVLPAHGRILYADQEAQAAVAALRHGDRDAYGLGVGVDPYRDDVDVRHAALRDHLDGIEDGGLGAVVLVGPPDSMDPLRLRALVAALGRVSHGVVLVSEAPWWWRVRLGPSDADLAPSRPLAPETWLAALWDIGWTGTADYSPGGRHFRLVAGPADSGPAEVAQVGSGPADSGVGAGAGGADADGGSQRR